MAKTSLNKHDIGSGITRANMDAIRENFDKTEKTINQNDDEFKKHKVDKSIQHQSEQIAHDGYKHRTVQDELTYQKGRIKNLVVGANGDGVAELKDTRTDIDGNIHEIAQDRLERDFLKIDEKAEDAKLLADKHENEIENSAYIQNIEIREGREYDTSYKIVFIPPKDEHGNAIKLKHGLSTNYGAVTEGTKPTEFAQKSGATYVSNASTFSATEGLLRGRQIVDGKVVRSLENSTSANRQTLIIGIDNTLSVAAPTVTTNELLAQGVQNALTGFGALIVNKNIVYKDGDFDPNTMEVNPRMIIGQLPDKTLVFFSCDGRVKAQGSLQRGMLVSEAIAVVKKECPTITFAYLLDGGGSTASVYRSRMLNKVTDNNNKDERAVYDFLYVAKDQLQVRDADLQEAYNAIGGLRGDVLRLYGLLMHFNLVSNKELYLSDIDEYAGIVLRDSDDNNRRKLYLTLDRIAYFNYDTEKSIFIVDDEGLKYDNRLSGRFFSNPESVTNCNTIQVGGSYLVPKTATGSPYPNDSSAIVKHFNAGAKNFEDATTAFQEALPFARSANYKMRRRSYDGTSWSQWFDV